MTVPITMHTPGDPCCDSSSSAGPPPVDCLPCGLPASGLSASVRYRIALCSGPPFIIDPCECYGGASFPVDETVSGTLRFVDKPLYLNATLRSPYHWVSGPHCVPTTVEGEACGCPGVVYAEAEAYFVLACEDVAGVLYVARRWKWGSTPGNLRKPTCDSNTPAYAESSDRGTLNMSGGGNNVGDDSWSYRSFTLAGSCSPLALSASYTGPACSSSPIRYTAQQEDVSVTL